MEAVVFLRGANAIGSRVFSPVQLASELADLGVVNVGAAGTFVVRAASRARPGRARHDARVGDV